MNGHKAIGVSANEAERMLANNREQLMTTIHLEQPVSPPFGSIARQRADGSWTIAAPAGQRIALVVAPDADCNEPRIEIGNVLPGERERNFAGSITVADQNGRQVTIETQSILNTDEFKARSI